MTNVDTLAPVDLNGGYDPQHDFLLPGRPDNPKMRDSVSMWISDDEGRFGLPRFCIEAVASQWDDRGIQANIAFPDGRVLIGAGGYPAAPPKMVGGKAVSINAGPLTFEVIEPLRRWRMTFDGAVYETTVQRQFEGELTGKPRHARISVDATMGAPPWSPGEQSADPSTAAAVGAVGGHRHEQLFRCEGRLEIDGEPVRDFKGTGLRIRRYGARETGPGFPGHVWMSGLFPSGKAFGVLCFPPRTDGTPAYDEAIVYIGGKKRYGRVLEIPWLKEFVPNGGPVDLLLDIEGEKIRIGGRTHDSTAIAKGNPLFGNWSLEGTANQRVMPFHQGGAHYTWDGETTYGMIERSHPEARLVR